MTNLKIVTCSNSPRLSSVYVRRNIIHKIQYKLILLNLCLIIIYWITESDHVMNFFSTLPWSYILDGSFSNLVLFLLSSLFIFSIVLLLSGFIFLKIQIEYSKTRTCQTTDLYYIKRPSVIVYWMKTNPSCISTPLITFMKLNLYQSLKV